MVRGVGFEPTNPYGTAASETFLLAKEGKIDFEMFKEWLYSNFREFTAKMRYFYAIKYYKYLLNGNLAEIRTFSNGKKEHTLKALSLLSKWLGCHEYFKALVKNYGIKLSKRNNDDIIISRLCRNTNAEEIYQWIRETKKKIPELSDFLELMAITGLRLIEAIDCNNLVVKLSKEQRLSEYYNEKTEILEHYRFKELFIRNSKKVFISFVPKDLVQRIAEKGSIYDYERLTRKVEYWVGKRRFSDIRELHATILTKYLTQPEIDFLQGRVSANVFMRNYFNPSLINDLKQRVFKGIAEIMQKIK